MATASIPRQSKSAIQQESLERARFGQSVSNYPAIYRGFAEKGIPESEINPRENIFTYAAWKALGRQVRRGEHGVKVMTVRTGTKRDTRTGEESRYSFPTRSTVFHVSQTEAITANGAAAWKPTKQYSPAPSQRELLDPEFQGPTPNPAPAPEPVPEPVSQPTGPFDLKFEYLD